jgi:putative ABC transport system permease protein
MGYLLLGIANKLVAMTAQRRHEVATLRLNGMTPRQVLAMMRREAGLVAVAAVAGGLVVSAVPLALLGVGFLGRPLPDGPWWVVPGTLALVTAIAYASIVVPTRRALRFPPAEVLSQR